MKDMKIVKRQIKDLHFADYNPRQLTDWQYDNLRSSIESFGFVEPIIVNKHANRMNIIVGGEQRTRIWGGMGNTEIDTIEVKLPLKREKELNVRMNLNTGEFDFDTLANNYDTHDLIDYGFTSFELGIEGEPDTTEPRYENQVEFKCKLNEEQSEVVKKALAKVKRSKLFKELDFDNPDRKGNALFYMITQYGEMS